jgi:ATP-dependent Clp protease ATP-binding subunit ClpA
MLQKNSPLEEARRIVIDHIVQQGVFKPEFVNRFDAVVLFHPLTIEYIEKIAAIMLDNLSKRLSKKGFSLSITSDLVHFVAEQGVDPVFGARPMHRYIQDHIEQIVADKVISGELREGGHITLSPADLKIATPQQAVPQPTPPPTPPPGERMSP